MAKKGIYARYQCAERNGYAKPRTINKTGQFELRLSYPSTVNFYTQKGFSEESGMEWQRVSGRTWSSSSSCGNYSDFGYVQISSTSGYYMHNSYSYTSGDYAIVMLSYGHILFCDSVKLYSRGTYLADIIADYGSLPADGKHTDGYWYVFIKMASDLKGNVNEIWRDMPTGYINDGGILKPQSELKGNVEGIWR